VSRASTGKCIGAELTALTLTAATTATIVRTMRMAVTIVRTTTEDTITTIEAEPQTRGCGVGFNCFDIVPIRVDSKPRLPREGCAGGVAAHLCHIDSVDRLTAVLRSPIGALVAAFSPLLIKQQPHHKNFF
jgi:hypothetical protein